MMQLILANVLKKLPAKCLLCFYKGMVTNYKKKKQCQVQVVMDMDGFGSLKRSTYKTYIFREPVQFTGFKLFFTKR
jgi:hypothetical protein